MTLPWRRRSRRELPSEGPSTYAHLRTLLLSGDPKALQIEPTADLPNIWATVVEMHVGRGVASIVAVAEGSVSLYTSTGGGILGGGQHKQARDAGHLLLTRAEASRGSLEPRGSFASPQPGRVGFIVLTYNDKLGAEVPEIDMQVGHPLYPLYDAAQDVVLELRRVSGG